MISWLALMHKGKEELRIEKNGGGMSWETCRKADYLDDDDDNFKFVIYSIAHMHYHFCKTYAKSSTSTGEIFVARSE